MYVDGKQLETTGRLASSSSAPRIAFCFRFDLLETTLHSDQAYPVIKLSRSFPHLFRPYQSPGHLNAQSMRPCQRTNVMSRIMERKKLCVLDHWTALFSSDHYDHCGWLVWESHDIHMPLSWRLTCSREKNLVGSPLVVVLGMHK